MKESENLVKNHKPVLPFINYCTTEETNICPCKILVVSPHQMDEAVACAGTILKYAREKAHIEILYCSHIDFEKMKESEKAASLLGSYKNHFMQFPKNSLAFNKNLESSLEMIINKVNPDIAFFPYWISRYCDGIAIAKTFLKISENINLDFTIYAYSVWSALIPNCIFDISKEWETKKKIIDCYSYEKKVLDYLKIAQGINQYWGQIISPNFQYAEAFFKCSARDYISLGQQILK
ncbi:MAG: PIG-L family deacetylase [Elusimicrobiota bacterium]|nr:PIG-L family deacetylase [Elusimicrobiota bacterium]